MKSFPPSASPKQRAVKRVPKPVMEKRRRERINQSLEALRLMMLENTNDERMENPKVEKAEILESVVQFLKTETNMGRGPRAPKRGPSSELRRSRSHQHSYSEGVRSCLLQVSQFIASRSQGAGSGESVRASPAPPGPQTYPSPPAHIHGEVAPAAAGDPAALTPHHHGIPHPYFIQNHYDSRMLVSPTAAPARVADPVWRPWPQ
ncbi:hairy-related 5 [Betta splendens]|uniref:Hairy-related 5 n=1 Tax=Betta splendens TaxID=158456 RepID=A0A6P7NMR4_BETSP|nr:hairy-related 5 [Betta splendens]